MPVELVQLLTENRKKTEQRRPEGLAGGTTLYAVNKKLFHSMTRWALIRETAQDWACGDEQQRAEYEEELAVRYFGTPGETETRAEMVKRVLEENPDAQPADIEYSPPMGMPEVVQSLAAGGECLWSGEIVTGMTSWGTTREGMTPELRDHLQGHHPKRTPTSIPLKQEICRKSAQFNAEQDAELRREIIERNSDILRDKMARGPQANVKKIFCKKCELMYSSTAGAMEKHAQNHRDNSYIRIGRKKNNNGEAVGEYRPEQHLWNQWTGRYYFGSDAKGWKNIIPRDALHKDRAGCEYLRCRKCKTYKILFNHDQKTERLHNHAESIKISRMVAHEAACKPKAKETKKDTRKAPMKKLMKAVLVRKS
ncbi:unnamed protein product [Amoebophrya sp. A120]|nr:unnamed protein product [Amoebophrya sp. A120]|eukprot:GSA120T00021134001.1